MFGAVPGVFKNKKAANLAAKGFQIEEDESWIVLYKGHVSFFKPCRKSDEKTAQLEGWVRMSDGILGKMNLFVHEFWMKLHIMIA